MTASPRLALPVALALVLTVVAAAPACRNTTAADGRSPVLAADASPAAFIDVTVVPMVGDKTVLRQTVVVRDGRIAAVGPSGRVDVPADARRISGAGKYLMPGLVDAHFHLQSNADDARLLRLLLANGVTSILNLYGTPSILDLRERVATGEVAGPTIYTSGPYISDAPRWQPDADEVERLILEQKRAGYDLIKTHGDFSREAFQRLCAVAHRENLKIIGHAPRNLGVEPMFEDHMDAVAHAEEFIYAYFFFGTPDLSQADAEVRRRFLEQAEKRIPDLAAATAKSGIWVVPNLVAYTRIVEQGKDLASVLARPETKYVPAALLADWQPGRNRYDRKYSPEIADHMEWRVKLLMTLTGAFHHAGVRMMAGTDAPIPGVVPGFSQHDELKLLVAAGLSPSEALRAATVNAATFLGKANEFGTVEAGKRADLLLLNDDPLQDVANTSRYAGVMVRGQWLDGDALRRALTD